MFPPITIYVINLPISLELNIWYYYAALPMIKFVYGFFIKKDASSTIED